jgi:outer membrane protein TolC
VTALLLLAACGHRSLGSWSDRPGFDARTLADPELAPVAETSGSWPPNPLDLPTATRIALVRAPAVAEARAEWAAAEARLVTAKQRRNPTVTVALGLLPLIPEVALDLPLSPPGRRARRIQAAELAVDAARLRVYSSAWAAWSDVAHALVDEEGATARVALLTDYLALQQEVVRSLEGRSQAGALPAAELLPARLLVTGTSLELGAAREDALVAGARLAGAMGLPRIAIANLPLALDLEQRLGPDAAAPDALRDRADVLAAVDDARSADAAVRSERAGRWPDLLPNGDVQWDPAGTIWTPGLTFELPLFGRNQGPLAEAVAAREIAASRLLAVQAEARGEIDTAEVRVASATTRLEDAGSVVQGRLGAEEAARARVAAGAGDPHDLTYARLDRMSAELARLEVQLELRHAEVDLTAAVQRPADLGVSPGAFPQ